jgi:hypothetical protein
VRAAALLVIRERRRRDEQLARELEVAAKRRRQQTMQVLALLTALLSLVKTVKLRPKRRVIQRGAHGWEGSAINEYVMYGDDFIIRCEPSDI